MTKDTLLFDLDGTLTDPKPGIVGCIRFALNQLNVSCPDDVALETFIGPPLRRTFAQLLDTADSDEIEHAMELYRQRYARNGLYENRVYEGIPSLLEQVNEIADAAFVATSKPTVFARRIVDYFGLDHYFRNIYGAELDGRFDDKVSLVAHLLASESINITSAIMIGDRSADVLAAKANGLRAIGVLWGYGSDQELIDAGADLLVASPSELSELLLRKAI